VVASSAAGASRGAIPVPELGRAARRLCAISGEALRDGVLLKTVARTTRNDVVRFAPRRLPRQRAGRARRALSRADNLRVRERRLVDAGVRLAVRVATAAHQPSRTPTVPATSASPVFTVTRLLQQAGLLVSAGAMMHSSWTHKQLASIRDDVVVVLEAIRS
jgi:hypothetical protein